jgi:hypothetical protein
MIVDVRVVGHPASLPASRRTSAGGDGPYDRPLRLRQILRATHLERCVQDRDEPGSLPFLE